MTDLTTLPDAELCERAAIMLGWEHPNPHLSAWEDTSGRYRGGGLTPIHLLADVLAWLVANGYRGMFSATSFGTWPEKGELLEDGSYKDQFKGSDHDGTPHGIARAVLICALRAEEEKG